MSELSIEPTNKELLRNEAENAELLKAMAVELQVCTCCGQPIVRTPAARYRQVIASICEAYGVPMEEVMGEARSVVLVHARHACYAALRALGLSNPHVGRIMGRDHTTIIHGVRQHKIRMERLAQGLDN